MLEDYLNPETGFLDPDCDQARALRVLIGWEG